MKKEVAEIVEDPKDKILCVLIKNIEVALEEKKLAAVRLKKLKSSLNINHSIKAIKEEMKNHIASNIGKDLLWVLENIEDDADIEEVAEEYDEDEYRVRAPIESNNFFNRFTVLGMAKSEKEVDEVST